MTDQELAALRESLTFLHVDELREVAAQLNLESKGSKMVIQALNALERKIDFEME